MAYIHKDFSVVGENVTANTQIIRTRLTILSKVKKCLKICETDMHYYDLILQILIIFSNSVARHSF